MGCFLYASGAGLGGLLPKERGCLSGLSVALLVRAPEVWWGPWYRAPPTNARPEPGPSEGPGQSSGQVRPWSSCAGEGRPWRDRTPPTSFPCAPAGRAAALPAVGGSTLRLAAGGFIVSEAVLCMGGPLLTVCASWLLPAGHGSHGPTMYHSPDLSTPPSRGACTISW